MTRLNMLLLAALVASALGLVNVSYESRRLFVQLERERALAKQLNTEFERLDVERRAQATSLRVEKAAREQLRMRTATPAVTQYVVEVGAASAPQGATP
jgi:cell division protein FtsL